MYDKPYLQMSRTPYRSSCTDTSKFTKTIYYGEVISIDDESDGGRIKVRVQGLDIQVSNENLPWAYPILPKFFHVYPQVGELVRIFIEDTKYPEKNRFWEGSIISQPQKIGFDSFYSALSTTDSGVSQPLPAPKTSPDSDGVFPTKTDIALVGRINTDVILKINEVHIRAGKHENNDILKLNVKNPAEISLIYELSTTTNMFQSNAIIMSDKIALISHEGDPKFKAARLTAIDRNRIFEEGHPIARGDVTAQAFEILRSAIISHIHGYLNEAADKSAVINNLENLDFSGIYNKNIVIN
jgi:hypothetical protein